MRGCRLALKRPLGRGAVVQLRFELGAGQAALDAVGQVSWTRPAAAGVVFVSVPRGAHSGAWIDALVAAQLRRVLQSWESASGTLAPLAALRLQLGIPPTESLDRGQVTLVRLARDGVALAALSRSPEAVRVLATLLERGVLSLCRATPDPEGWKQALSMLADTAAPARGGVRPGARAPSVIVAPLPDAAPSREAVVERGVGSRPLPPRTR